MSKGPYRFLFVNLPLGGHLNPMTDLAETLIDAGHQVTFVMAEEMRETIEQTGANFVPYDDYDSNQAEMRRYLSAFQSAYQTAKRIGRDYDCLVYEMLFVFGAHLADELDLPRIRLFSTFAMNHHVLDRVIDTAGFPLSIFKHRHPVHRSMIAYYKHMKHMMYRTDFLDELAEEVPDLNIVYTSREFQLFEDEFDERFQFVGPPITEESDEAVEIPYDDMDGPIIYVAMGSMIARFAKDSYKKTIEAFRDEDVHVILSVGDEISSDDLGDIPDHVHVYSKVPQVDVLSHSDVFITHGGMNSVNEAIYQNVPMIVTPLVNDQMIIATQLLNLGIAKRVDLRQASPEDIKQAARLLMSSEPYQGNMKRVSENMRSLGGNNRAAELILDYLDQ